jgi:hypothetical protein
LNKVKLRNFNRVCKIKKRMQKRSKKRKVKILVKSQKVNHLIQAKFLYFRNENIIT